MNSSNPDTAGYLHQEVLKNARYLVVTVDRHGLVAKQECPGIAWRFDELRTGRMLPDALQGILDSCTDSLAPQLFPYVHLSDDLITDIHVLNRGDERQIILQDVSHGHDDEHKLQQKAHEVSLLLEQQAELNRKLEEKGREALEASRAKSRFIAAMSHEFRSPIFSIMAQADSLGEKFPQQKEPGALRRASWYLLTLVENLLGQAQLEEGGTRLNITPVDARAVFEDLRELFEAQAASAGIEFLISVPDESVAVSADELRLRQVMINLVSNALRHTRAGSVCISLELGQDAARLGVQDTGEGIAKEDQESIFEPFTQLRGKLRGGAGLGLAISRQLVGEMGGRLEVDSEPGKGSEFYFSLSLADPHAGGESLGKIRVLIVEDDEDIREIYRIWLSDWGCNVSVAESCEQARKIFASQSIELVLSDLCLEDGNGAELLRELRGKAGRLPAVLCSGSDAGLLEHHDDGDSMTVLVSKPVNASRLRSALLAARRLADSP